MWSLLCKNVTIYNPKHNVPDLSMSCPTLEHPQILKRFGYMCHFPFNYNIWKTYLDLEREYLEDFIMI